MRTVKVSRGRMALIPLLAHRWWNRRLHLGYIIANDRWIWRELVVRSIGLK